MEGGWGDLWRGAQSWHHRAMRAVGTGLPAAGVRLRLWFWPGKGKARPLSPKAGGSDGEFRGLRPQE